MYNDIIAILLAIAGAATPDQMRKLVSFMNDEDTKDISKITCPKPYDDYYIEFDYGLNRWVFKEKDEVEGS